MLKRLVDFVVAGGSNAVPKLTLQDITMCQLWHGGQTRQRVNNEATQAVQCCIESWLEMPPPVDISTAGRRHQGLLRALLSQVETREYLRFLADEVAFLYVASTLITRCKKPEIHDRFTSIFEAHQTALRRLHTEQPPTNDVRHLNGLIQYATEKDIQSAAASVTRLFAGVDLPCRGPVFTADTHLRILGDVPDNCTVVVENEGSCSVDGYVMGRILAKNHCEVRQNISGVAIVLRGHIRARSIINNALVIAKMGNVVCNNAQGPKGSRINNIGFYDGEIV